MKKTTKLLTATGGAVTLALAAGGIAYASSGSPSATTSPPSSAAATAGTGARAHPRLGREMRRILRHTVHADLIVHTEKGFVTVEVDRGTFVSDSSHVITLKRPDGPSVSATVTGSTRFFGLSQTKLVAGDKMVIVQTGGDALIVGSKRP